MDIDEHPDAIDLKLHAFNRKNKGRFGAWRSWFLPNRPGINAFLHEHPGANAVNDLREIIMAGWQGVLKDDPEKALNDIERMDWDRRLSEGEADEMGADECLGCVRGMLMAVQGHSPVHAAMWGERVIDFLDYENAPPVKSAAEHEALLLEECRLPIGFLDALKKNGSKRNIDSFLHAAQLAT